MSIKQLIVIMCSLLVILFTTTIFALDLHEQPDSNSKLVGNVPKGQPLIPIYFQNDWVKVADPSNGNVGWVNRKSLSDEGYPTFQVKTFSKETKNNKMQGYQIFQYSSSEPPISQKQMDELIKFFQSQQSDMQKQMHQIFEQAFAEGNKNGLQPILMPVLQPIILVPEKSHEKK